VTTGGRHALRNKEHLARASLSYYSRIEYSSNGRREGERKYLAGRFGVTPGLTQHNFVAVVFASPAALHAAMAELTESYNYRWNSTVMNEEGFSDKVRQVRAGHASPIVTNEHYAYVRDSVSRRAGEAIDDRLE
jgi:hypothetical protein